MEAQTPHDGHVAFYIEILGPQLLHPLVLNPVLAHFSLKGQSTNQKLLAVLHQLNYVYNLQFLLLPAVG